jgi:predicted nuclease of predicted toxin-antitoxin system
MRFKIDENLPIEVAGVLRDAGHDAMTIVDQRMSGEPDPRIAAVCRDEDRAILTLDLDFSDIRTYPPSDYPGIVVLRPSTQSKGDVLALVVQLLPLLNIERLIGNLWILQRGGLRIREGERPADE